MNASSPAEPADTLDRRLLRQVQELGKFPKCDQQATIRTIEAFLAKAG